MRTHQTMTVSLPAELMKKVDRVRKAQYRGRWGCVGQQHLFRSLGRRSRIHLLF